MSSSISTAWLDPDLTSAQAKTFDDAWDLLVVREAVSARHELTGLTVWAAGTHERVRGAESAS